MTHRAGKFALMVVLALAASSVTASASFAADAYFKAGDGVSAASVSVQSSEEQWFETDAASISCESFTGEGSLAGTAPDIVIQSIDYGGCQASGLETTFSGGNCDYILHGGELAQGGGHSVGTLEIGGDGCAANPITYDISGLGLCTVTVGPQTLESVDYEVDDGTSPDSVDVSMDLSAVDYTMEGILCGATEERQNGSYTGDAKASAKDSGVPVDLTVVEPPTPAFFKAHNGSGIAETSIEGAGQQILVTDGLTVTCSGFSAAGSSEALSSRITLEGVLYSNCEAGGLEATIDFGSCDYIVDAGYLNEDGTSSLGRLEIGGEGCAEDPITFDWGGLCTLTIGPQAFAPIPYVTEPGSPDVVDLSIDVSGLKYSEEGFWCGVKPDRENGTLEGNARLSTTMGGMPVDLRVAGA